MGEDRAPAAAAAAAPAGLLTVRASPTGASWTPSCSCCAPACSGTRLRATGICNSSTAHRRFQEWERAGVFHEIWRQGLLDYDQAVGIDWAWLAADGAMTKAPLGGEKTGPNPTDRGKKGRNARSSARRAGVPIGLAHDGANRNDHKLLSADARLDPHRAAQADRTSARRASASTRATTTPRAASCVADYGFEPHIRSRGEEIKDKLHIPGWRARRWVVEACHSWLNRNRALLIRWSKKAENHLALLQLASGLHRLQEGARCATRGRPTGIGP